MHGDSSFLTLTYDEEHHAKLPLTPSGRSLDFSHHEKFLKSLRRRYTQNNIRYYGCGEYGERSGRPHFHYILHGFPACSGSRCHHPSGKFTCEACNVVRAAWKKGHIYLGEATKDSIAYVANYITKGWTQLNDYTSPLLDGRVPEDHRCSGGLGGTAIDKIAEDFINNIDFSESFLGTEGDVPSVLKTDGRLYPIGRYLKSRFRKKLGWSETGLPKEKMNEWKKEMQQLYEKTIGPTYQKASDYTKKVYLQEINRDAVTCIENKFKKFNLVGAL